VAASILTFSVLSPARTKLEIKDWKKVLEQEHKVYSMLHDRFDDARARAA
jgi:hypothetical protein